MQPTATEHRARRWIAIAQATLVVGFQPTHRNTLHWLSWAFALGLEFLLIALLHDGHIYDWERALTRLLQRLPTSEDFLRAINFLTNTLSLEFLTLFTLVLAMVYLLGWRLDAWLLLLTFPLHVLAQFPKALIDRPRPSPAYEGIEGVGGFQSFPSGHAEFVITFWGFLAIVACAHLVRRWQRIVVLVAWLVLALTTGVLRIAMGRHWPIDVFASYLIGLGILSGLVWLRRSLRIAIVTNDYRRPTPDAGSAQVQES